MSMEKRFVRSEFLEEAGKVRFEVEIEVSLGREGTSFSGGIFGGRKPIPFVLNTDEILTCSTVLRRTLATCQ